MKNQKGFISIIVTIIITALLVGGGTYILEKSTSKELVKKAVQENTKTVQRQAQLQMEKLAERIEELEKEVLIEEDTNSEEGLVYKNSKYKFSLVFPDNWAGYQFEENDDGIYFGFPEQLHFWALSIMTHQDWNAIKNEEGPKPKYISENNDYVFTYSTGHDEVPSLQGMLSEVKDIVKTFKFLDNNTADWQTYTNENFVATLKYPKNWEVKEFKEAGIFIENGQYVNEYDGFLIRCSDCSFPTYGSINVYYTNISTEEFTNRYNNMDDPGKIVETSKEKIAGLNITHLTASTAIGLNKEYIIFDEPLENPFIIAYIEDDDFHRSIIDTLEFSN